MSTYENWQILSQPYKKGIGQVGHYMPLVAEFSGFSQTYGTLGEHCGPLLFHLNTRQRPTHDANITFTYKESLPSDVASGNSLGRTIYYQTYITGTSVYSGTLSIPSGAMANAEYLFTESLNVSEIVSLECDDERANFQVFALASPGSKLLYGLTPEENQENVDRIIRGVFVSSPQCVLCGGTGIYHNYTCPDCKGMGYVGYGAEDWLLQEKAAEVGVTHRDETVDQTHLRAWAKKWWISPTVAEITKYVAFFSQVDTGFVEIYEHQAPECYYEVLIPNYIVNDNSQTQTFSLDPLFLNELLDNITPAGVSHCLRPYNGFISETGTEPPSGMESFFIDFEDNATQGFYDEMNNVTSSAVGIDTNCRMEFYFDGTTWTFAPNELIFTGFSPTGYDTSNYFGYTTGGQYPTGIYLFGLDDVPTGFICIDAYITLMPIESYIGPTIILNHTLSINSPNFLTGASTGFLVQTVSSGSWVVGTPYRWYGDYYVDDIIGGNVYHRTALASGLQALFDTNIGVTFTVASPPTDITPGGLYLRSAWQPRLIMQWATSDLIEDIHNSFGISFLYPQEGGIGVSGSIATDLRFSGVWNGTIWSGAWEAGKIYSGFNEITNDHFYSGYTREEYEQMILYDGFLSGAASYD